MVVLAPPEGAVNRPRPFHSTYRFMFLTYLHGRRCVTCAADKALLNFRIINQSSPSYLIRDL
jgi:hypothetical protein